MPQEHEQQPGAAVPEPGGGPQGESDSQTTEQPDNQEGAQDTNSRSADEGTASDAVEEVELEGLEKDDDGNYVYVAGSSTYKGKNLNELLGNIRKGVADKDDYIGKLRAEKLTAASKVSRIARSEDGQPDDDERTAELPAQEDVYREQLQRSLREYADIGLKAEMLVWTLAEWDAFADSEDVKPYRVSELRQAVREIKRNAIQKTEEIMDNASTVALNEDIIRRETRQVRTLLEESGLSDAALDKFDYEKILTDASKKRNRAGVIESGAIVAEAARWLQKALKDERTSPAAKKVLESFAAGDKKRNRIPESGGGTGAERKPQAPKITGDYDKAMSNALRDLEGSGFR